MLSSDGSSAPVCPAKVQSVDDFVPDDGLDKSFLEDSLPLKTKVPQRAPAPAVDSDRWDVYETSWVSLFFHETKSVFVNIVDVLWFMQCM